MVDSTRNRNKCKIHCYDHYGHEFDSISAMCQYWGIEYHVYKARRAIGWTLKEALETPLGHKGSCNSNIQSESNDSLSIEADFAEKEYSPEFTDIIFTHKQAVFYYNNQCYLSVEDFCQKNRMKLKEFYNCYYIDGSQFKEIPQIRRVKRGITYNNIHYRTILDLAESYGMNLATCRYRLLTGIPLSKPKHSEIIYRGKRYSSLKDLAMAYNIPETTCRLRLIRGDALDAPSNSLYTTGNIKPCIYKGVQYESLSALANKLGIRFSLLNYRRKNGIPLNGNKEESFEDVKFIKIK